MKISFLSNHYQVIEGKLALSGPYLASTQRERERDAPAPYGPEIHTDTHTQKRKRIRVWLWWASPGVTPLLTHHSYKLRTPRRIPARHIREKSGHTCINARYTMQRTPSNNPCGTCVCLRAAELTNCHVHTTLSVCNCRLVAGDHYVLVIIMFIMRMCAVYGVCVCVYLCMCMRVC